MLTLDPASRSARIKAGMAEARTRGVRIGRPRATNAPDTSAVAALRAEGKSWGQVARQLGCTSSAAQRAAGRGGRSSFPDLGRIGD